MLPAPTLLLLPGRHLPPGSPEFVPQSVHTFSQGPSSDSQPVPSFPMTQSPSSGPGNTALPQREVRRGERARHPPPILTY